MKRLQAGGVERAGQAYREERAAARDVTPMSLRWRYRRLRRQRDQLGDLGLAQLRAVSDEFVARGLELPA